MYRYKAENINTHDVYYLKCRNEILDTYINLCMLDKKSLITLYIQEEINTKSINLNNQFVEIKKDLYFNTVYDYIDNLLEIHVQFPNSDKLYIFYINKKVKEREVIYLLDYHSKVSIKSISIPQSYNSKIKTLLFNNSFTDNIKDFKTKENNTPILNSYYRHILKCKYYQPALGTFTSKDYYYIIPENFNPGKLKLQYIIDINKDNPVKVIDILYRNTEKMDCPSYEINIKNIYQTIEDYIKNNPVNNLNLNSQINNNKTNTIMTTTTNKNSMFNSLLNKIKGQYLPERVNDIRLSMDMNLCVRNNDEYISIDKDNNLVSYPEEFTFDFPVFIINKLVSQLQEGDIVKHATYSYSKVLEVSKTGKLKLLSFSGYNIYKTTVKDFLLGQSLVPTVINMFNNNLQQVNGMNPMMLMMLMNKEGESSSMMESMMMMQMFNQNGNNINPFGQMFGNNQPNPSTIIHSSGEIVEEKKKKTTKKSTK